MTSSTAEQAALRFVVPDLATFQALLALLPTADGPGPEQLVALYPDTADLHLLRHGYTLCIQPHAEALQLTLCNQVGRLPDQLTTAAQAADDEECTDSAGIVAKLKHALNPQRWPAQLASLRDMLPRQTRLVPLVLLQRTRYQWQAEPSAAVTATVAGQLPDSIAAITLDAIAAYQGDDERHLHFDEAAPPFAHLYEVTLLPLENEVAQAQAALASVKPFADLAPLEQTTLARALAARSQQPPCDVADIAGVQPTMAVAEACRLLLHTQLIEMVQNEAGARFSDEIEYVHAMRVAIRRARAAFKLYSHFFHTKATRRFRKQLRETAHYLGNVRDLDVALDNAQQKRSAQRRAKKAQKSLVADWQTQRAEAHQQLVAWLDSAKYSKFIAEFYHFCTTPGVGAKVFAFTPGTTPVPQQVRHVVPSLLMKRFEQVRTYEALFAEDGTADYATIHALRIDCKYLRYSLEFVRHLLGSEVETLIERLKTVQDLLGDLNDAVVASEMASAAADVATDYLAQQQAVVDELSRAVPAALARFVDTESRQRFGAALANL